MKNIRKPLNALLFSMLMITMTFTYLVGISAVSGTGYVTAGDTCPITGNGWTKYDNWADEKKEQSHDAGAGYIVTKICVKGGNEDGTVEFITNETKNCWIASGIGSQVATIEENWEGDDKGSDCKDISHASFFKELLPTPTPTTQPSATPTPTISPTVTTTPTTQPTVTPTNTTAPTATPTPTTEPTVTPTSTTEPTATPSPTTEPSVTPTTEPTSTPEVTTTVVPTETGNVLGEDTEDKLEPVVEGQVLADTGRSLRMAMLAGSMIIGALIFVNKQSIESKINSLKKE